jgi:uncharacterized protein YecT (DUF1311 family)
MQQDTRRLTVARDHLRAAYDEVTRAIGLTERSMAEQAAQRGRDQLDLVVRKLQDEQIRMGSSDGAEPATRALSAAQHAWQSLHDALNDWEVSAPSALSGARTSVLSALEAVGDTELVRTDTDFVQT